MSQPVRRRSLQTSAPFRTVFRETFRSLAISLKCLRRIRAIISTITITHHLLHSKAGSTSKR